MTTADRIAHHARERPDAVALVSGDRTVSFAEFSRDIGKFAAALRQFELPRGEATRQFFKDGWFHPNDLAILDGPRRVKLLGRADAVINIGGGKLAPEVIEGHLMKLGGVGDVGVCTFDNREGIQELYIAVAEVQLEQRELLDRIASALSGEAIGRFHVVMLAAIPRNIAGKIERATLKQAVSEAIERSGRRS